MPKIATQPKPDARPVVQVDPETLKQAMITVLRAGIGLDMRAAIAAYPESEGHYCVDYLLFDGESVPAGLEKHLAHRLRKEGEYDAFFDSPEPAVELFLKLKERYDG